MSSSEWKEVALEQIVDVLGDGLHGTPKYDENGEYYFINGNNLDGNIIIDEKTKKVSYEEFLKYKKDLNERTILISINGTLGNVAFYNGEKVVLGKSACYFNVKENCSKEFIKYIMLSHAFKHYINTYSTGTTIKNMGLKQMRAFRLNLPEINEQKAIAHILSTLDDKIEVNNQINKTLENMAQAIFKQWFVAFEFPNEDGEPYKSSGGEMVESELGMIPKGWEVKVLGEIIDIHDSKRIPLSKNEREKREKIYPYYGAASLMDYVDKFIFDGIYVLLGEDGTVVNEDGSPVLQYVWGKFWVNNHAHVLTGRLEDSVNFLYILLKNINIRSAVTGAVQLKINQKNLCSIKIALPKDNTLISKYISTTNHIFHNYRVASEENQVLTKLRGTLLPKLMSGEIRVPLDEEGDT